MFALLLVHYHAVTKIKGIVIELSVESSRKTDEGARVVDSHEELHSGGICYQDKLVKPPDNFGYEQNDCIHIKQWDIIIHPCLNSTEVIMWMSNYISRQPVDLVSFPCLISVKLC